MGDKLVLVRRECDWHPAVSYGAVVDVPRTMDAEWEPWAPSEGQEFCEGDFLYPACWWPEKGVAQNPPPPLYTLKNGVWNPSRIYADALSMWELAFLVEEGETAAADAPRIQAEMVFEYASFSDSPGWAAAVSAALDDYPKVRFDGHVSILATWKGDSVQKIYEGSVGSSLYEALAASARDAEMVARDVSDDITRVARTLDSVGAHDVAELVKTAYSFPKTMPLEDDDPEDHARFRAAESAMKVLTAKADGTWQSARPSRSYRSEEIRVDVCGRWAAEKFSVWMSEFFNRIRSARDRQYARLVVMGGGLQPAPIPGPRRQSVRMSLQDVVREEVFSWAMKEVRRQWAAEHGEFPWDTTTTNPRLNDEYCRSEDTAEAVQWCMEHELARACGVGEWWRQNH